MVQAGQLQWHGLLATQECHREKGSGLPQQSRATVHLLDGSAANCGLQAPPSSLASSCYGQTAFLPNPDWLQLGYAMLPHVHTHTHTRLLTAKAGIPVTQIVQISLCPSLDVHSEH